MSIDAIIWKDQTVTFDTKSSWGIVTGRILRQWKNGKFQVRVYHQGRSKTFHILPSEVIQ